MRIITLHCDYIKFKPLKKALKDAEELKTKDEIAVEEPLVVLTAVEKGDSEDTAEEMARSIEGTADSVKAKKIVLYPYAHLSSDLANPKIALDILENAEKLLKKKKFEVTRAPFGYYKEFELKCKGHPLSELSRKFGVSHGEESGGKVVEKEFDPRQLLREISRAKLDTSKLKENDHRILGQKLDLFSFNEVAPGDVFWHHNGLIIFNELVKFWREVHEKEGYQEISTPQILDNKLWKVSGHWDKYRENMFITDYKGRKFGVKPMNCPGGILVFKTNTKSYKELPLRVAELGIVHRQELSGVLSGLFRVVKFTQDDAHIYCSGKQLDNELIGVIELTGRMYRKFNLDYRLELSTRPEKKIGSDEDWDKAEEALSRVLKKLKIKFKLCKGAGAFYGPKIDFHVKDSLGREWQTATLQLDFAMPERFSLEYIDKDNTRKKPIMLHRTVFGSLERFIGILLEHLNGALPVWLSPIQVRAISFTDRNVKAVEKFVSEMKEKIPNLRVDADIENMTVNEKVRNAELMRIPYIIVIGDKEEKSKTIAVRKRGKKPKFGVKFEKLVKEVKEKIEKRI